MVFTSAVTETRQQVTCHVIAVLVEVEIIQPIGRLVCSIIFGIFLGLATQLFNISFVRSDIPIILLVPSSDVRNITLMMVLCAESSVKTEQPEETDRVISQESMKNVQKLPFGENSGGKQNLNNTVVNSQTSMERSEGNENLAGKNKCINKV